MAKQSYSKYQQNVIGRYYDHLDTIMLQKLQELVTELFLAKDTPKEDKLWVRVQQAMVKLKIPKEIVAHIMMKRDVTILAKNLEKWLGKKRG